MVLVGQSITAWGGWFNEGERNLICKYNKSTSTIVLGYLLSPHPPGQGGKIIRNRAGLECSRPAFKPFAPTWTTLTKIHLSTISKDSVLIKQPPYYLNYPITSDGTLAKVLLYESIRLGEDVLDNSFIVFLSKKVFFFFSLKMTHMIENASRNSQSYASIWGVLQQFVRHILTFSKRTF